MSPDFLPLEVGNLWRYQIAGPDGEILGRFEVEVLGHAIVEGSSVYVFSRFPLLPEGFEDPIAVRFDREGRQYLYTDGQTTRALFPSRGVGAQVTGTDPAGVPREVRIDYGDRTVTLERGVGLTSGTIETAEGVRTLALFGARVGGLIVGDASPQAAAPFFRVEEPVDNVVLASEAGPVLEVEAEATANGHLFRLRARNLTEKLLAFDFRSSQSFDFVVTDPGTGEEVWRWARRMFFSQVIRSEAIRIGGQWSFEAEWNHRDNDLDPVPPGRYRLRGFLTSETGFESDVIEFEVP
jgi:hypothetical protein